MTKQDYSSNNDAREIATSPQDEEAVLQATDNTTEMMIEQTDDEAISDVNMPRAQPKRRSIIGRRSTARMSIIDRD